MIAREWRARADYGREEVYPSHFRSSVMPDLRRVPGFTDAVLLRRDIGDGVEFTVITTWASMEAVCAFAGADPGKAVVEAAAIEALRDYDRRVSHHTVLERLGIGADLK